MSTKQIEAALKDYSRITGKADDALLELYEIRKAAKAISRPLSKATKPETLLEAQNLMEFIAEEES